MRQWTDEQKIQILDTIAGAREAGMTLENALKAHRITRGTFYKWRENLKVKGHAIPDVRDGSNYDIRAYKLEIAKLNDELHRMKLLLADAMLDLHRFKNPILEPAE